MAKGDSAPSGKEKEGTSSGKEDGGMDAIRLLRIGAGVIAAILVIWLILHYVLHVI